MPITTRATSSVLADYATWLTQQPLSTRTHRRARPVHDRAYSAQDETPAS